jgi:hypothetical protein
MEQLYIQASDALSKYADAGTRASIVQDLFGKAAKESANAFAVSRNEINEMRAAAAATGQVLSDETIANAKKAKDEMEAFSRVINIHLTDALVQVAPLLVKGAKLLSEIAEMAGWAARRMGLLADVTAEQKYQALLEKRLDTSERIARLSKTFFGWIDEPTKVLIAKAKQELAEIDAQIVAINKRARTDKPAADKPAITGAVKPVGAVNDDTFRKLLADLQKETDRVGMEMTASEQTRADERLNIARNEWFTKANFAKLSTDQQKQFLAEFQEWNVAATAMEEQRVAAAEQARVAKIYNEYTAMAESFNQKLALETWYNEQRFAIEEFFNEGHYASVEARNAAIEQLNAQHAYKEIQLEQQKNSTIVSMQNAVYQQIGGLMQAFAGKNRLAAIAAIVVQKGLGIAQTIINTQVASMRALAELGPIAGPPMAAKIQTLGKASVALISATGLAEIASLGKGGADLGSSANPVHTSGAAQPTFPNTPAAPPRNVTIVLQGEGAPSDDYIRRVLIPGLQEAVGDGFNLVPA